MLLFIDGEQFGLHVNCTDYRGNRNAMRQFTLQLPPLAAGEHTLRFKVDENVTTDRSVILDDVRLTPIARGEYVAVPNPGFESVGLITFQAANGYYLGAPPEAGWAFSGAGICGHSTWFSCLRSCPVPGEELEDLHKAYLQKNSQISTTVNAPRAGTVVFTMRYGNRANMGWTDPMGSTRSTGHTCRMLLDGEEIGSVKPTCEAMRTFVSAPFSISAGEHTLTITNIPPNSSVDVATVVDDIRIAYDVSPMIAKGETYTAALAAPSNGFYRLNVTATGPELQLGHVNGSNNGYSYYPVTAYLYLDGNLTSKIRLERPEWTTVALVLPYLSAGSHTLAFTVSENAGETASNARFRVGALDLQPLTFLEKAAADAMKDTTIRLGGTGKLDLQFEGQMTLGKLFIDGTSTIGEFSAASDPTHFTGPGVLVVQPKGTTIIMR